MPGKAYTRREMKLIVDYLAEQGAYEDIRGRKMWMAFANSKKVDRTWQSLKETFLKRILPDIHNPYYKLTTEQIASFRQGYDVAKRNKNKLQIQTSEESSNSKTENQHENKKGRGTSKKEENPPGENIQCSMIQSCDRSSTETLVLENCYENAEDIQRDLETPKNDDSRSIKTLKDLITYSEPLTPMLQDVLDDFATDDEEHPLQIDEDITEPDDNPDRIRESENLKKAQQVNGKDGINCTDAKKVNNDSNIEMALDTRNVDEAINKGNKVDKEKSMEKNNNNADDVMFIEDSENGTELNKNSPQKHTESNSIIDTPDSLLPNNQEGLQNNSNCAKRTSNSNELSTSEIPESNEVNKKKSTCKGLQLKITEKTPLQLITPVVEAKTDSVIEIKQKPEEPIVIDSHSTINADQDSAKHFEDSEESQIRDNKNTINQTGQEEKMVNEKIPTTNPIEQKNSSKENNSQEAGPSGLNKELDDSSEMNPCLKSVSLYAEQFSQHKISDSEHSDKEEVIQDITEQVIASKKEDNSNEKTATNQVKSSNENVELVQKKVLTSMNDVVLLKSHTESESEQFQSPKPKKKKQLAGPAKTKRDNALANVFGFSTGKVSRKRSVSHRDNKSFTKRCRTLSRNYYQTKMSGSSSTYSSSDSSPPCCQKDSTRGTYMKPKSYDILTQAGGGGLFVIGDDKKLYEVVMSDKSTMNHLRFDENGYEKTDEFWRKKYFEEKLRADELSRLLKYTKESITQNPSSPILPAKPSTSAKTEETVQKQVKENGDKAEPKSETSEDVKDNHHVKIKFTKDNEIELECQWPHVHPVLEQMARMFHKNTDKAEGMAINENKATTSKEQEVNPDLVTVSSGKSTPVVAPSDPVIQERINNIESEIFKEIEERDETETKTRSISVDSNVTTRKRGRPNKVLPQSTSTIPSQVPSKKAKTSSEGDVKEKVEKSIAQEVDLPSDAGGNTSKRPTGTRKKTTSDPKTKIKETRASNSKQVPKELEIPDDSQVRYMFPKSPTISKRNSKLRSTVKIGTKPSKSYQPKTPRIFSSPEIFTTNSIESTQGYQDSDNSPTQLPLRRKRKLSVSSLKGKEQSKRNIRRKSYPYLADDDTFEDIISDKQPTRSASIRNSSCDTEVYRSESYQLLLPKARNSSKLNKIDELSSVNEQSGFEILSPVSIDINEFHNPVIKGNDSSNSGPRIENSSNVSLPLSPELSVVENMSISKDMLLLDDPDQPNLNETLGNESNSQEAVNKYMISDLDMSVPLMEQDCELRKTRKRVTSGVQLPKTDSESLVSEIDIVNLEEPSTSDSLDQKLRNMLLESAKKMSIHIQNDVQAKENMEVDPTASEQKKRAKKRCSTPRKKMDTLKSKIPTIGPVVEERIEFCSRGGRSSCPPTLNVADLYIDDVLDAISEPGNKKGKKKKDIIKVKILRPTNKNKAWGTKKQKSHGNSHISVCTDSGINDTESGVSLLGINGSVDLIHNHSETCVYANECIGDSVEFLNNTTNSIISLGSNTSCSREGTAPDLFCDDAREATSLNAVKTSQGDDDKASGSEHTRVSPKSFNSLITEDLSEGSPIQTQPRRSKWYLLSDEETTSTNIVDAPNQEHNAGCFNSNLKQIFPITCAIPDLSTISEMSRENDSRKPTDVSANSDVKKKDGFQSIFD